MLAVILHLSCALPLITIHGVFCSRSSVTLLMRMLAAVQSHETVLHRYYKLKTTSLIFSFFFPLF